MDQLLAPEPIPELSEMAPAAWLGIGEGDAGEFSIEDAPVQVEDLESQEDD